MYVIFSGGNVICLQIWGKDSGPYMQALHFAFGVGAFMAPLVAAPFLSTEVNSNCTSTVLVTTTPFVERAAGALHKRQYLIPEFTTNLDMVTPTVDVQDRTLPDLLAGLNVAPNETQSSITTNATETTPITTLEPTTVVTKATTITPEDIPPKPGSSGPGAVNDNTNQQAASGMVKSGQTPAIAKAPAESTVLTSSTNPPSPKKGDNDSQTSPTTPVVVMSNTIISTDIITQEASQGSTENATSTISSMTSHENPSPVTDADHNEISTNTKDVESTTAGEVSTTQSLKPDNATEPTSSQQSLTSDSPITNTLPLNTTTTLLPTTEDSTATLTIINSQTVTALTTPIPSTSTSTSTTTSPTTTPTTMLTTNPTTSPTSPTSPTTTTPPSTPIQSQASSAATPASPEQKLSTATTVKPIEVTVLNVTKPHDARSPFEMAGDFLQSISRVQFSYIIIAAVMLLFGMIFVCLDSPKCSPTPPSPSGRRKSENDLQEVAEMMMQPSTSYKIKVMSAVFVFFFLYVGTEVAYGQFVATFSIEHNQFSPQTASFLTSVYWGSFALARGLSVPISKCLSPTAMIIISIITTIASILGLTVAMVTTANSGSLWVLTATMGAGMAAIFPTGVLWLEGYIKVTSRMAAVFVCASALGEMLIPAVAGYLIDKTSPVSLLYTTLVCVLGCGVTFVAMHCLAKPSASQYRQVSRDAIQMAEFEFSDSDQTDSEPILPRNGHRGRKQANSTFS
mgnify:CR=1 FL=1